MNVLTELRRRFETVLAELTPDPAPFAAMVKPAQDTTFGDFQANCAMSLAKQLGTNPKQLATEIVGKLQLDDLCQPPEVAGPGFINLRLRDDWLLDQINRNVADPRLGVEPAARPKRIVVDYSAPNVAKPMHVGHLRSTVLGNALYRVLKFCGHHVIGDNHIGDWGTQFGMILFGYKNFLDRPAFEQSPVAELARLYRLVNQLGDYHTLKADLPKQEAKVSGLQTQLTATHQTPVAGDKSADKTAKKLRSEIALATEELSSSRKKIAAVEESAPLKALADANPKVGELARLETAKLHAGDEENTRLWNQFLPECLKALQWLYDRLDIRFDLSLGESFFNPWLAEVVADLQSKKLAVESDKAICVFVPGNAAPFIIRKGDGAFTYATTDLATIQYRVKELQADTLLYVVDARQSEHFRLLFEVARLSGYRDQDLVHIKFGTIMGKDNKPYKTRSGDTVGLESLLDAAVAKAAKIVADSDDSKKDEQGQPTPDLDPATRAAVAETVGIGAIKYADLRHNRESDYVYDEDKMLATTGDTATYMQYAYARVAGIFRKGNIDRDTLRAAEGKIQITHSSERALSLQLLRFTESIDGVATDYRPNILTDYLFATANSFSTFYQECSVLKEPDAAIRTSRLLLCDLTARVISTGLNLLGIETCEKM